MPLKSMKIGSILAILWSIAVFEACVPAKHLEDAKAREKACNERKIQLEDENRRLTEAQEELKNNIEDLEKSVNELSRDTTTQGNAYRRLNSLYEELTESYDKLLANNDRLLQGNTEETRKLIGQLNKLQEDLMQKEDRMRKDSLAMNDRENRLDSLRNSLKERDERVRQLESILGRSDSTVSALKNAVSNALLGFQNKGLTVEQRGSRVYVSMEEQLLFASGSTVIEKKGEEALRELARVLEKNSDINVMVEGHTDNVPISGVLASGARDNWELSVLRATSIVKIMLKGSTIDPMRITASGKGPYSPIDPANTAEARRKNRRTEIILTHKLDDLLKLLEQINQEAK